jgi:hypothetical protein
MTDTDPAVYTAPTREAWLQELATELRPWFADLGHEVPEVRVSVGFTSKGARSNRIGECWYPEATEDGVPQVFLHPKLVDPWQVAATLVHELVHATLGPEAKHGRPFRKLAVALGLTGKMTATVASDELLGRLAPVLDRVGPYPHAGLASKNGTSTGPKQTTRMLKVQCPVDGYLVRTTRQWLDHGLPTCPDGHLMEEA